MKPERTTSQLLATYSSLAFILPCAVVVGYIIGYFLDNVFGTTYLKMVFLVIGIAAGFVELIRILQREMKKEDDAGPRS